MKRELALQLLQTVAPGLGDEATVAALFRDLQFLAEYKYNKYEMYHPGRLFLESLYLWLQCFDAEERKDAIAFVRSELIFVSRQEFQQLAGVLYYEVIRRQQLAVAARLGGRPPYKVRAIRDSSEFKRVSRASLYVGMSDGARIDYIRRHNLSISNEQVLPYYETSEAKAQSMLRDLRGDVGDDTAQFSCLFLIDDFCGSGQTLLREVVTCRLPPGSPQPSIPAVLRGRLRYSEREGTLELVHQGPLGAADLEALRGVGETGPLADAIEELVGASEERRTVLRGALSKVSTRPPFDQLLAPDAVVFLCPLLMTERAVNRLRPLLSRLPGPFARTEIRAAALLDSSVETVSPETPIGRMCDKYYRDEFGDEHTGTTKFGFNGCGLPLVLHHNTPNNSLYLLWARQQPDFHPLFVRYERHRREES